MSMDCFISEMRKKNLDDKKIATSRWDVTVAKLKADITQIHLYYDGYISSWLDEVVDGYIYARDEHGNSLLARNAEYFCTEANLIRAKIEATSVDYAGRPMLSDVQWRGRKYQCAACGYMSTYCQCNDAFHFTF